MARRSLIDSDWSIFILFFVENPLVSFQICIRSFPLQMDVAAVLAGLELPVAVFAGEVFAAAPLELSLSSEIAS